MTITISTTLLSVSFFSFLFFFLSFFSFFPKAQWWQYLYYLLLVYQHRFFTSLFYSKKSAMMTIILSTFFFLSLCWGMPRLNINKMFFVFISTNVLVMTDLILSDWINKYFIYFIDKLLTDFFWKKKHEKDFPKKLSSLTVCKTVERLNYRKYKYM